LLSLHEHKKCMLERHSKYFNDLNNAGKDSSSERVKANLLSKLAKQTRTQKMCMNDKAKRIL
jgi:hypothetical protein